MLDRHQTGTARRRIASAAILALALGAAATLGACNTVAGAGQDLDAAGHGVTNGANAVKNGS